MKILVTGSTGLIGSALIPSLLADGHSVVRLVRKISVTPANEVFWDPRLGTLNPAMLEGYDAVVHLAGESIAGARWTPENKRRILDSRVQGTRLLVEALLSLSKPPGVLISASAIGFYGNRGAEILREESPPGTGFLPDLCRQWEDAAQPASKRGIRVVTPRIGLVLSGQGGALARMLLPFKLGVGGKIGPGNQYLSWIALDDLVGSIRHMIQDQDLSGPVNAVSPRAVTNLEFTRALGRTLSRPTLFPLPAFAARIVLGEMADELLLASARVEPARLLATGFQFRFSELEAALRHVLNA
jgi:uncharacterized protein (TIGR01777 family)